MSHQNVHVVSKFPRAGYRIHFDRLRDVRLNASFIRTHKFKCDIPRNSELELFEKFEKIAMVVDSGEVGSGMWFLIQLVGVGFLLPMAGNKFFEFKKRFGASFDLGFPVPNQVALSKTLQTGADSVRAIESALLEVWDVDKTIELPVVAKTILQRIENERGDKKLGGRSNGLNEWVKRIFADELYCGAILDVKKKDDYLIFNEKFLDWNSEMVFKWISEDRIPLLQLDDVNYSWYFNNLLPASEILQEKVVDLMNPYHVLGKYLVEWRQNTQNLKFLLEQQLPESFKLKEEFISLLVKHVQECAQKVPSEKDDFLKANWAEYRETNFSGRLAGWLSNFENRLKDYEVALANNIYFQELKSRDSLENELNNFFLESIEQDVYVFRKDRNPLYIHKDVSIPNNLVNLFGHDQNKRSGEVKRFYLKKEFRTDFLIQKFKNINKSHAAIFTEIKEGVDYERLFSVEAKEAFEKLQELQPVVLNKLREVVFGAKSSTYSDKSLGEVLDEYRFFLRVLREFLMIWENEGIDKEIFFNGTRNRLQVYDGKGQRPESFWISSCLLSSEGDKENDLEQGKIGFFSRDFVPSELKKYPSFVGQAKKVSDKEKEYATQNGFDDCRDERIRIFNAKFQLLDFADFGNRFCCLVEKNQDDSWEGDNWMCLRNGPVGDKEVVYDLGTYHKTLESLRKIALLSREPKQIHDFLRRKCKNVFLDNEVKKIGSVFLDSSNFRFYLSGREYSKGYWRLIPVEDCSLQQFLVEFEDFFGLSRDMDRDAFSSFFGFQNMGISNNISTQTELLKLWWALRLKVVVESVQMDVLPPDLDKFIKKWVSLASIVIDPKSNIQRKLVSRKMIHRFVQSGFGSEMRGKVALLTRNSFIERHVIQVTNGGQSILRYVPREWGDFSRFDDKNRKRVEKRCRNSGFKNKVLAILDDCEISYEGRSNYDIVNDVFSKIDDDRFRSKLLFVLGEVPHSWEMILLSKHPLKAMEAESIVKDGFFIEKSEKNEIFNFAVGLNKNYHAYAFKIVTSRYQKQFLERFLFGDSRNTNGLEQSVKGAGLILERTVDVKWERSRPVFQTNKKTGFVMYMAVPFGFSNTSHERYEKGMVSRYSNHKLGERVLGIDLGEYGFGWAIFDVKTCKFLMSGFQRIPLLQKLRDRARSWRDTQSRGIFSRPTTYLEEIRQQAAGQARNQIHRIAMEFGARPIYEDSVDAFESGGNRIEKLYKTLKTADVIGGLSTDADKALRKHIWGSEYLQIGGVIGAAKTSQTCRKCGRCATAEIHSIDSEKLVVIRGCVKGTSIHCDLEDGEYDRTDVENAVKKTQRAIGADGGQSLFVCQYLDCRNSTHADEQAAKNIALKYYLANYVVSNEDKKNKNYLNDNGHFSTLRYFLQKSPNYRA